MGLGIIYIGSFGNHTIHDYVCPQHCFGCMMSHSAKICLVIAFIVAAALTIIYIYHPGKSRIYPPCPFYALTGLFCPGCGSARALHQLLHGNFLAALDFNPLMVSVLPVIAYETWYELASPKTNFRLRAVWVKTLLAAVVSFWILRNLPFYPFRILAP